MSSARTVVPIAMPRLSDSMEEATVVQWLKASGDAVARGEALVEVETDKATTTYEAEYEGVLGELLVAEGEVAKLGAPIAELLVEGAPPIPPPAPGAEQAGRRPAHAAAPSPSRRGGGRVRATPVARRAAAHLGVALHGLAGSGPRGRIVRADVLAALESGRPSRAAATDGGEPLLAAEGRRIELTGTQRTIAHRMTRSRTDIPEFTLTAEIDMTAALELRRELRALHPDRPVSVNDLVVKAVGLVLREQPGMNASWAGDHIVRHGRVNVGIAVAVDDALLVPVVADADRRSLLEIAREARALGERARARRVTPAELSGATFTVTNLGMFGVLSFDAVIDAPQASILAVGAVVRRPAFADDGALVGRDHMLVSLSCDHRVVYGADGARFLERLRRVLESPLTLLLPPLDAPSEGEAP